ncbi:MAG: hypothetical protein JRN51_09500 [Nitrososphaerota archaeon]|nr:hypothetical protein [Nitrososphaerota archaeon]
MKVSENIWVIAAVIYVAGMLPLWYYYNIAPFDRFSSIAQTLPYISIFGAVFVLFTHILVGAWGKGPKDEDL